MKALLLIDIQNDFQSGGALAVPAGDENIDLANRLQPHIEHVIASQDWHPPDHGSFAANHPGARPGDTVLLAGIEQTLWPVHCLQGSRGAELAPGLDTRRIEKIVYKGTDASIDSYSALFDNGHRKATELRAQLEASAIDVLYLAGLATDYCVKFTALDARQLGFRVVVIEDACRGIDLQPGDVANALAEMRTAGVEILPSREILAAS